MVKYKIKAILTPSCWGQRATYNKDFDSWLQQRIAKGEKFKLTSEYRARLGDTELWIGNHPYASFTLNNLNIRPSRATILMAYDCLVRDVLDLEEQDNG